MDGSASQCTIGSGTESGWTLYLDQSFHGGFRDRGSSKSELGGEEEGLSMVSDASSGPPNCHEDCDQESFVGNGFLGFSGSGSGFGQIGKKKKKKKSKDVEKNGGNCSLDDTASSPVLSFSKRNMNFSKKPPSMEHVTSQGFSATHFKEKSKVKKHFGFFKSEKGQ